MADEVFVSNVPNGCSDNFNSDTSLIATFTRSQYQCDSGYCLPANTDHCVICPEFYDCVGGTFTFNETMNQGQKLKTQINSNITNGCREDFLWARNNGAHITATFTPNTHTCSAGQYLPAGVDACTQCPANSYCGGGTFTFNETVDQGVASCGSGLFAPAGMWESAQCGRILHVGDGFVYLRTTNKTLPSLRVDVDQDGVADYFGNMTTLDVPMSHETQRKFKVRINDMLYSIYDDSVDLTQYQNE